MHIRIEADFNSVDEYVSFLRDFGAAQGTLCARVVEPVKQDAPVEVPVVQALAPELPPPVEPSAPKKRGRPVKTVAPTVETSAMLVDDAAMEDTVQPAPTTTVSLDDARAALKTLSAAVNIKAAMSMLADFNVSRVGELKPDQIHAFIDRCMAAAGDSAAS